MIRFTTARDRVLLCLLVGYIVQLSICFGQAKEQASDTAPSGHSFDRTWSLSSEEIHRLELQWSTDGNGDAALRLSHYYATVNDPKLQMLWEKRAAISGVVELEERFLYVYALNGLPSDFLTKDELKTMLKDLETKASNSKNPELINEVEKIEEQLFRSARQL